jgi:uncharacterized MAPEG superfamily protein
MPIPLPPPELLAALPRAVEAGATGTSDAATALHAGALFAWSLMLAGVVVNASLFPLAAARSKADFTPADLAAPRSMFERLPAWGKWASWAHQNSVEAFTLFAPACLLALFAAPLAAVVGRVHLLPPLALAWRAEAEAAQLRAEHQGVLLRPFIEQRPPIAHVPALSPSNPDQQPSLLQIPKHRRHAGQRHAGGLTQHRTGDSEQSRLAQQGKHQLQARAGARPPARSPHRSTLAWLALPLAHHQDQHPRLPQVGIALPIQKRHVHRPALCRARAALSFGVTTTPGSGPSCSSALMAPSVSARSIRHNSGRYSRSGAPGSRVNASRQPAPWPRPPGPFTNANGSPVEASNAATTSSSSSRSLPASVPALALTDFFTISGDRQILKNDSAPQTGCDNSDFQENKGFRFYEKVAALKKKVGQAKFFSLETFSA